MFIGFSAFIAFLMLTNGALEKNPVALLFPCGMAAFGYFAVRASQRNLVDEVYDCGDYLLVRNRGEEDTVPLSNIINVNFGVKPPRITLTLDPPGKFGAEVWFAPPPQVYFGFTPRNEIAADLLMRADKARTAAGR